MLFLRGLVSFASLLASGPNRDRAFGVVLARAASARSIVELSAVICRSIQQKYAFLSVDDFGNGCKMPIKARFVVPFPDGQNGALNWTVRGHESH